MPTVIKEAVVEYAGAPVALSLHVVTSLSVTAADARRRVNREVVSEMGTGLIGRDPDLVVDGDDLWWRVPIVLSLPNLGDLGQVGYVDVDAHTGQVHHDPVQEEKIVEHARRLYTGATHPSD
jgi:hypothetical protein